MRYLLGIDLGTSGVKVILMAEDGTITGEAYRAYGLDTPRDGWAEQAPEQWRQHTEDCVRQVLAQADSHTRDAIEAVGLSGQMHGTVVLDADGHPLRPAILWCDQRSAQQAEEIHAVIGKERLGACTLNPAAAGFLFPTLLWLKQNEPQVYAQIHTALLPKDYIRYTLTGRLGSDITDASSTCAFDTAHLTWAWPFIEEMKLPAAIFPAVGKPWQTAGTVTPQAARRTGLKAGTPVAYGGGDQPMHCVGNGLTGPGVVSVNIGTGGQVCMTADKPLYDKRLRIHTFASAVPGCWNLMGAISCAGLSLRWLTEHVVSFGGWDILDREAAEIRPGSDGLLFLPYLNGVRTPHMDTEARGAFLGLTFRHGRAHMARAIMEGVAFSLRECIDVFGELGITARSLLASGGGAKSALWRAILADVFGADIQTSLAAEQACLGAAITAGVASGVYASVAEGCRRAVRVQPQIEAPHAGNHQKYNAYYELYKQAYGKNRELLHALSGVLS